MTPYYEDESVTIYHGDCREAGESIAECVVTSPPYNVGIGYDEHDDVQPWAIYWAEVREWAGAIARAMGDTARSWLNVAPVVQEVPGDWTAGPHSGRALKPRQSLLVRWAIALECAGLEPADIVAWCSQRGSGTAWGSWQSPSAPNLRGDWEAILVHYKGCWKRTGPEEKYQDAAGNWPTLVSNTWDVRPDFKRADHPAPFPIEIAARAIRLSTWPGETVLDPFMGSGTTLRAAKDLGRKAIGFDISERYCELAALRCGQGVLDFDEPVRPVAVVELPA